MVAADSMHSFVALMLLAPECESSSGGTGVYDCLFAALLSRARESMSMALVEGQEAGGKASDTALITATSAARGSQRGSERAVYCDTAAGDDPRLPYDDTSGWGPLEALLRAAREMLRGAAVAAAAVAVVGQAAAIVASALQPFRDEEAFDVLVTLAAKHTNRFVRQDSQILMKLLVEILHQRGAVLLTRDDDNNNDMNQKLILGKICASLVIGLRDDWSQIRRAAVESTQAFFVLNSTADQEVVRTYVPLLLPALCMNRFYAADGTLFTCLHLHWQRPCACGRGRKEPSI